MSKPYLYHYYLSANCRPSSEKVFLRTASGPPSYIISSLTSEVSHTAAMSSVGKNQGMSPVELLSSQSSGASTPDLSPIKDILEFVPDTDSRSREAESDSSRGRLMLFIIDERLQAPTPTIGILLRSNPH